MNESGKMADENNLRQTALTLIEQTGANVFLTGRAGTGKTTFLRQLVASTRKRAVVLAPTGVAAINAGGSTIHSFFQLSFAPFVPGGNNSESKKYKFRADKQKIIRTLDLLIIDEISMVRPDVLDAVDEVLRRYRHPLKPFGGVQLLLIGDLRQLAPVVKDDEWALLRDYYATPYFFDSHALKEAGFVMIELEKVYRQQDTEFLEILNGIRDNMLSPELMRKLNARACPSLMPADDSGYIRLTSHNRLANDINARRMNALDAPSKTFTANIIGNFPESSYPVEPELELKVGAQVMFIKNDVSGAREYYNGMLGEVVAISDTEVSVRPRRDSGERLIIVGAVDWQNTSYTLDAEGNIKEEIEGVFSQIPLRPAWAITIHKSQGLTFDKAIIDASHSFAPGQTYVALSRCRSLEGLVLESPIPMSAIITDSAVNCFISQKRNSGFNDAEIENFKERYRRSLLYELFDFSDVEREFDSFTRTANILFSVFSQYLDRIDKGRQEIAEMKGVVERLYAFLRECLPYREREDIAAKIDAKLRGGSFYFLKYVKRLLDIGKVAPIDSIDNKVLKKRLMNAMNALEDTLNVKYDLFMFFSDNTFSPEDYLRCKTNSLLRGREMQIVKKLPKMPDLQQSQKELKVLEEKRMPEVQKARKSVTDDIECPELYHRLQDWRTMKANGRPRYTVLSNRTLLGITNLKPRTPEELRKIPGMGPVKMNNYGEEILGVVNGYVEETANSE